MGGWKVIVSITPSFARIKNFGVTIFSKNNFFPRKWASLAACRRKQRAANERTEWEIECQWNSSSQGDPPKLLPKTAEDLTTWESAIENALNIFTFKVFGGNFLEML